MPESAPGAESKRKRRAGDGVNAAAKAAKAAETVAAERAMGFTHSHGDDLDVLRGVSGLEGDGPA